jgi:hypothetical protein
MEILRMIREGICKLPPILPRVQFHHHHHPSSLISDSPPGTSSDIAYGSSCEAKAGLRQKHTGYVGRKEHTIRRKKDVYMCAYDSRCVSESGGTETI